MRIWCRLEGWPGVEVCIPWVPWGRGGASKIPWTDRERAWQGALYLWNDLRCPLSHNVRRGTVVAVAAAAAAVVVVVVCSHHSSLLDCRGGRSCQSVDSCVPARRRTPLHQSSVAKVTCCGKTRPLPRRPADCNTTRACARVRVNICHMALPLFCHAACPTVAPRLAAFLFPLKTNFFYFYFICIIIIHFDYYL